MAIERVKVIKMDTAPANTALQELRNELKEAKAAMLSAEEGTEEYNEALLKAANAQHKLKEMMEEVNASAMDFGQIAGNVTKAVGGMVGGIQAATAMMNLFGIENEDVVKSLQTMQNLMALTQAIPSIDEGIKAFGRLANVIKASSVALQGLSKAFIASGLGAIAVLLGVLATRFTKLKEKQDQYIKKQKEYIKIQKEQQVAAQKSYNEALQNELDLKERILGINFNGDDVKTYTAVLNMYQQELGKVNERLKDRYNDKALLEAKKRYRDTEKELKNLTEGTQEYMEKLIELTSIEGEIKSIKPMSDDEVQQLTVKQGDLNKKIEEYVLKLKEAKLIAEATNTSNAKKKEKEDWETVLKAYKELSKYLDDVGLDEYDKEINDITADLQKNEKILEEVYQKGEISTERYTDLLKKLLADTQTKIFDVYVKKISDLGTAYASYIENTTQAFQGSFLKQQQTMLQTGDITKREYLEMTEGAKGYRMQMDAMMSFSTYALTEFKNSYEATRQNIRELLEQGVITEEQANQLFENLAQKRMELENRVAQDRHNALMAYIEEVQYEMDILRDYADETANAMQLILETGQGLSSHWTDAFNTMSSSLINLGQSVKDGTAGWQDYARVASAGLYAVGSMMSALAEQQAADTPEGFEQQKKYQIAAASMNLMGGIVNAWVSAFNPVNAWMGPWGQAAMGAATTAILLATGLMQIQKIKEQQFDGGGKTGSSGAGMGSGTLGTLVAPVQYTQDVQGADIENALADQRVYVLESDISGTQRRVNVAEGEARY